MKVDNCINKLKKVLNKQIIKCKYEKALSCSKTLSNIYYDYNQIYMDPDLENALLTIQKAVLNSEQYMPDKDCVFFYDGFGLDLRGWAASYIRALSSLGYYVYYACPSHVKNKIPHIIGELNDNRSKVIYVENSLSNVQKANYIDFIFKKYRPEAAFFYTTPDDVAAAIAFSNNNSTTRFQIDLTDHAFWIGVNAFDYILESREMGASLAIYERKICPDKIIKLDCVPYINRDKCDMFLPFNIYSEKYLFTGGALYKTLGDENLLYYRTITNILDNYSDIKFLYAGSGNDSEIKKLISKYQDRVFLIEERPDFFEIIKNCTLYINSYPMFGGLMMRYAALAHKIPITLKHGNDADGILVNQEQLGIEFDNYEKYILEIHKLLDDENYRKTKESLVEGSTLTEIGFKDNLKLLIEEHKTKFQFGEIKQFDTTEFRKEYKRRYSKKMLCKSIGNKKNIMLMKYFPIEYTLGIIIKVKEKIIK